MTYSDYQIYFIDGDYELFRKNYNKREKTDISKEEYENEYQSTLVDCSLELSNLIDSKKEELNKLDEEIQLHSREVAAAVDAAKRAEEIKNQADFYKL